MEKVIDTTINPKEEHAVSPINHAMLMVASPVTCCSNRDIVFGQQISKNQISGIVFSIRNTDISIFLIRGRG
jgi:hypothetical protein